jgi:hypothetical protein
MVLVLMAIVVSYREKLALEKDIIWSICRGGSADYRRLCAEIYL